MQELRGKRIAQLVSDLKEEGMQVSASDELMLRAYVRGTIDGRDLLAHVTQFSDLPAYQDWLLNRVNEFSLERTSHVSVAQLIREVQKGLRRRGKTSRAKVAIEPAAYKVVLPLPFLLNFRARVSSTSESLSFLRLQ
jgi:hypothetical protein